ncbi:MAG: hypothetical protein ABI166_15025 [Mucilaginibacter sp.]
MFYLIERVNCFINSKILKRRYRILVILLSLLFVKSGFASNRRCLATPNELENPSQIITVSYGSVACTCAQWIIQNGIKEREYIFLEPATKKLIDAENIWNGKYLPLKLKLTGSFFKQKGYPKNYHSEKGKPEPARVFRYTKIEIVTPYFKNKKHWGGA